MSPHRHRRIATALVAVLALTSLATACGDDDEETAATTTTSTTEAEAVAEIEVAGAWARTSPAMATAGAAYFELTNRGEADDALVAATVDESVAATAEVHETAPAEGAMGEDDGMGGGMMTMREVERVPVPAGETVTFEPGGYHVMLLDLAGPLEPGATIELTLVFESGTEVPVTAEVRDMAP